MRQLRALLTNYNLIIQNKLIQKGQGRQIFCLI